MFAFYYSRVLSHFLEGMARFQKMLTRVPGPPLTIKNDYDVTPPPQDFVYITETLYGGIDGTQVY